MTAEPIEKRSKALLYKAMDHVFSVYNKAGYNIKYLHVDPEFKFMTETMKELNVTVNLTAAQEHQPEIERAIRVIKETYQVLWHRLSYKVMPRIMIKIGVMEMVRWLNAFPPKGGVSTEYSPRTIMM